jgi:iron complex outermembrane recepter protein
MNTSLRILVATVSLAAAGPALAQATTFDVPATAAIKAIPEFARQAGIQIVAPADELKGITTPHIKGRLDTREALRQLLIGTGLEVASDDGSVITLRRIPSPASTAVQSAGGSQEQLEEISSSPRRSARSGFSTCR